MKPENQNNDPMDAPFEGNDPLWRLLGKAPLAEPDAWFTARTLARCRSEQPVKFFSWHMRPVWRWAMGGGVTVCLAMGLFGAQLHSEQMTKQKKVQEAFEIMASIDTDPDSSFFSSSSSSTGSSSSSSWQDSSL